MMAGIKATICVAACAMLVACGGGGSDGPSGAGPAGGSPGAGTATGEGGGQNGVVGLSATQAAFEETALAANGGMFTLSSGVTFFNATGPMASLDTVRADRIEVPVSPLGAPNGVMGTFLSSRVSSVPLRPASDLQDDRVGTPLIENGQIGFLAGKSPSRYTYVGGDVLIEAAADSGAIGASRRITGLVKVPLTGKLADAPQEFLNFHGNLLPHITGSTTFLPGAAYYKQTAVRVGERLSLQDDGIPSTDPKSSAAVFTGSVEQFAAAKPTLFNLSGGSFKTVQGARCWVSNTSGSFDFGSYAARFGDEPTFGAYCEIGQKVYAGTLIRDGAETGSFTSSLTPSVRVPYQLRLNKAAIDSIKAMMP